MIPVRQPFALVVSALLLAGLSAIWPSSVSALMITSGPSSSAISPTQSRITWQTNVDATGGNVVEYGLSAPTTIWNAQNIAPVVTVKDFDALNDQDAFAIDNANLWETTNGGATWGAAKYITGLGMNALEVTPNYAYIASDRAIIQHTLGGAGYSFTSCPLTTAAIVDMEMVGANMWMVDGTGNVYRMNTVSGACTSTVFSSAGSSLSAAGGGTGFRGIATVDGTMVAAISNGRGITWSTNGGSTWTTTLPATGSDILEDIDAYSSGKFYAVSRNSSGTSGSAYSFTGSGWTKTDVTITGGFTAVEAGSDSAIYAFGCCTAGKDAYSVSGNGVTWSPPKVLTTASTAQGAYFHTANAGWVFGVSNQTANQTKSFASTAVASTTSPANYRADVFGLQEGTQYFGNVQSQSGGGFPELAESSTFAFQTQSLRITTPVNVTKTATTGYMTWSTSIAADTRAHVSPTLSWQIVRNVVSPSAVIEAVEGQGDTTAVAASGTNAVATSTKMDMAQPFTVSPQGLGVRDLTMMGNRGWAVGNGGLILHNNGAGWSSQSSGLSNVDFLGVEAVDDSHAWIVGVDLSLNKGIVIRTDNGGASWQQTLTADNDLYDVVALDLLNLVTVGEAGQVYRSFDGGVTWGPAVVSGPAVNYIAVTMGSATKGWAAGELGAIIETNDGGVTWNQVFVGCSAVAYFGASALSDQEVWFVGQNGTVRKWTPVGGCAAVSGTGIIGSDNLFDVDFDPTGVWISGAPGLVARYGLSATDPGYKSKNNPALSVGHDTSLVVPSEFTGLNPSTAYNYFVQSTDGAGYTVVGTRSSFSTLPPPTLQVSKSTMSFTAQVGSNPATTDNFDITELAGGDIGPWLSAASVPWIQMTYGASTGDSVNGFSTPANVSVAISSAGLIPPGPLPYTYNATIDVSALTAGVAGSPKTINVTLVMTAPPTLELVPGPSPILNFTAEEGNLISLTPPSTTVQVRNSGGGTLNYTVCEVGGAAWNDYTVSGFSATSATPQTIVVSPNITGLSPGSYTETIKVDPTSSATCAGASAKSITVNLTITAAPRLRVVPNDAPADPIKTTMVFTATEGGSAPTPQNVVVDNAGGGTLSWSSSVNPPSASWLVYSPSSDGDGPTTLAVSPGIAPAGTRNAQIVISANGSVPTHTIDVTYTVSPAPPLITSTTNIVFDTTIVGVNPPDEQFEVTNCGPEGWISTVTTASGIPWLSIAPTTTASCPSGTVAVSASVGVMTNGTYTGTIRVEPPAGGTPTSPKFVVINVTLNIDPPPILELRENSVAFSETEGSTPAGKPFGLRNAGAGTMGWSITQPTASWAWITTSPVCGAKEVATLTGSSLASSSFTDIRVCVDLTGLSPGPQPSTSVQVDRAPGVQLVGSDLVTITLTVLADTVPPVIDPASVSVNTVATCSGPTPNLEAIIRWSTDEPSDSYVEWGEQLSAGVPLYERIPVLLDPVNTVAHTGGTTSHQVILDAIFNGLVSGHRYYFRISSVDRFGNPSPRAFIDLDITGTTFLNFIAPTTCDTAPPTPVTLTVSSPTMSGNGTFIPSATDVSGISKFELYRQDIAGVTPPVLVTVIVPFAADCSSSGSDITCSLNHTMDTRTIPDGSYNFYVTAFDNAAPPNFASSANVAVSIENSEPIVSNVRAVPDRDPVTLIWYAVISWDTDKQSNSRVDYCKEVPTGSGSCAYNRAVTVDLSGNIDLTSGHAVKLDGLEGGQIYHFQVTSCKYDAGPPPRNTSQCGN